MRYIKRSLSTILMAFIPFAINGCSNLSDYGSYSSTEQYKNNYVTNHEAVKSIREYASKTTTASQRREMKNLLEAYFQMQIDEGYTNVKIYKDKNYTISDVMIFNERGNKAILFINDLLKKNDDGIVKMFTGYYSKSKRKWVFSDGGIPNFYYSPNPSDVDAPEFTERMLIDRTLEKLANDGLVKSNGQISQNYINSKWF